MTFYTMMLGLLELMAPFIFRQEHKDALQESLTCYFEMMLAYYGRKDRYVCTQVRLCSNKSLILLHINHPMYAVYLFLCILFLACLD